MRRTPKDARAHILKAAEATLAERGPDKTGLKAVAERAGVSHSLVTHYFGSIDALIETVMAEHMGRLRNTILARMAASGLDAVGIVDVLFDELSKPLHGRLLAWALLTGRSQRMDFFPRTQQGMKQIADVLAHVTETPEDGREELELRIVLVATAALGYAVGASVLWDSLGSSQAASKDAAFRRLVASIANPDSCPHRETSSGQQE